VNDPTSKTRRRRMRRGIVLMVVSALIASTAAVAFYLAEGTGSKDATFSTEGAPADVPVNIVLNGNPANNSVNGSLSPGESANFDVQINNQSPDPAYVSAVGLNASAGDNGISGLPAGCLREWFTLPDIPIDEVIPGGDNWSLAHQGTLTFVNAPVNQNACQSITPTLHLVTR
jgi:hypothetical protein